MKQLLSEITRIRALINYNGLITESIGDEVFTGLKQAATNSLDNAAARTAIRRASREIGNDVDDLLRTLADDAIETETKLSKFNYVYQKLLGNPTLSTYATKIVDEIALTIPDLVKNDIRLTKTTVTNSIEDALKSGSKVDIAATRTEFKNALKTSLSYSDDVPLKFIDDFVEQEAKFIDDLGSKTAKSADFDSVIKSRVELALKNKVPPQKLDAKVYDQVTEYGQTLYDEYVTGVKSIDDVVDELATKCGTTKVSFLEQLKKFASPIFDAVGSVSDLMAITVKKGGKRVIQRKQLFYWLAATGFIIGGLNFANLIPGASKVLPGVLVQDKREFLDNYPWAKCFDDKGKFGGLGNDFDYWDKLGAVTFGGEPPTCDMVSDEFKTTNPSKYVNTVTFSPAEGDIDAKLIWSFGDGSQWTTFLESGNTTKTKDAGGASLNNTTPTLTSKGTEAQFKQYLKQQGFSDSDISNSAFNFTANESTQTFSFAGVPYTYDSATNSFK